MEQIILNLASSLTCWQAFVYHEPLIATMEKGFAVKPVCGTLDTSSLCYWLAMCMNICEGFQQVPKLKNMFLLRLHFFQTFCTRKWVCFPYRAFIVWNTSVLREKVWETTIFLSIIYFPIVLWNHFSLFLTFLTRRVVFISVIFIDF